MTVKFQSCGHWSAWGMTTDPTNVTRWKHKFGFRRNTTGHFDVEVGRRTERLEPAFDTKTASQGRRDDQLPAEDKQFVQEVKRDSNTIVYWTMVMPNLKTEESTIAIVQNFLKEWCGRGVDLRQRVADWAVHIFHEHKEAGPWAARGVNCRQDEWVDIANVVWSEVTSLCGFWDGILGKWYVWCWDNDLGLHQILWWCYCSQNLWPGVGSEHQSVKRNRFDRGQQFQTGSGCRTFSGSGTSRSSFVCNGRNI